MSPVPEGRVTAETWITAPTLPALVARAVSHYRINQEDGEDLLQETRIALWEAGQEVVGAAWVAQVASHKAVDLVRRLVRARAHIRAYAALPEGRRPEPEVGLLLHARVATLPSRIREFYDLRVLPDAQRRRRKRTRESPGTLRRATRASVGLTI